MRSNSHHLNIYQARHAQGGTKYDTQERHRKKIPRLTLLAPDIYRPFRD